MNIISIPRRVSSAFSKSLYPVKGSHIPDFQWHRSFFSGFLFYINGITYYVVHVSWWPYTSGSVGYKPRQMLRCSRYSEFPKVIVSFYTPLVALENSNSFISSLTLVIARIFHFGNPGVYLLVMSPEWNLVVFLIWMFLMASDIEDTFSEACWPFGYFVKSVKIFHF